MRAAKEAKRIRGKGRLTGLVPVVREHGRVHKFMLQYVTFCRLWLPCPAGLGVSSARSVSGVRGTTWPGRGTSPTSSIKSRSSDIAQGAAELGA
jgi:hypothetical protein